MTGGSIGGILTLPAVVLRGNYCRAKNACSLDCGLEMTMIVDHLELDWRYVV